MPHLGFRDQMRGDGRLDLPAEHVSLGNVHSASGPKDLQRTLQFVLQFACFTARRLEIQLAARAALYGDSSHMIRLSVPSSKLSSSRLRRKPSALSASKSVQFGPIDSGSRRSSSRGVL